MGCGNSFSPMQITAGAGLLGGLGGGALGISSSLTSAISKVTSIPAVAAATSVVKSIGSGVSTSIVDRLKTIGATNFPGLTNVIPASFTSVLGNAPFTDVITAQANDIFGADMGVFSQHLAATSAYVTGSNSLISAAINAGQNIAASSGYSDILSGGISAVTDALPEFSSALSKVGSAVDFGNLDNLGNPIQLAKNFMNQAGGLPMLDTALEKVGLDALKVGDMLARTDYLDFLNRPAEEFGILQTISEGTATLDNVTGLINFTDTQIKNLAPNGTIAQGIFNALGKVTGENLDNMQAIIGSTLNNMTSAQDYLDPSVLFETVAPALKAFDDDGNVISLFPGPKRLPSELDRPINELITT